MCFVGGKSAKGCIIRESKIDLLWEFNGLRLCNFYTTLPRNIPMIMERRVFHRNILLLLGSKDVLPGKRRFPGQETFSWASEEEGMRRYILTLFAAAAFGLVANQAASAADLNRPIYKAPPPPPPAFSWTGLYVGVQGGAGWATIESSISIPGLGEFPWSSHTLNGWLFGGQIGYNWQVYPWLVLGIEGDGNWADIEGTAPCGIGNTFSCNTKIKWTADITGRVGFAVDRALLYVKGGVVWAGADYNSSYLNLINFNSDDTRVGGLFGAGIEYAFLHNWSAKIEYNFMDFGKHTEDFTVNAGGVPVGTVPAEINQQVHVIKVGLNYRFDGL